MNLKKLRDNAIKKYIQHQFVLVKLRPKSKMPMERDWSNLEYRPDFNCRHNFGVVLQHDDLIIDVDPRNYKSGVDSLEKLKQDIGELKTFTVRTGSGGFHFYFKKPATAIIKKKLKAYPGIEFLSKGAQIVGACCVHPDTNKLYTPYNSTKLKDIAAAPDPLLDMLMVKNKVTGHARTRQTKYIEDAAAISRYISYLETTEAAIEGEGGDDCTYKVACRGKDLGLSPATTLDLISDHYNVRCDPPWPPRELRDKVNNAYEYGKDEVGCLSFIKTFEDEDELDLPEWELDSKGNLKSSLVNACNFLSYSEFADGAKNPLYNCIIYNTLKNRLEFSKPAPWHHVKSLDNIMFEHLEISDAEMINIKHFMDRATGLQWNRRDIQDAVIKVANDNQYNPVQHYIESLVWDGKKRLDNWLTKYCGAKDSAYTRAVGAKTLVAAVARTFHPGIKFDYMLILEGRQGIGKSTAVNILGGEWYADIVLRTDHKDTVQLINGAWIIEVSEMAGLRKAEIESLKAFLSRPTDSIRPPYGKTPQEYPRRSIFIGTINPPPSGYLRDESGNRRYWPVWVKYVDIPGLRKDRDQIFAEAYYRFRKNEKLYLDKQKQQQQAQKETELRMQQHPWLYVVSEYLDTYDIKRITIQDLYRDAINGSLGTFKITDHAILSNIMQLLGWKTDGHGRYTPDNNNNKYEDKLKEL